MTQEETKRQRADALIPKAWSDEVLRKVMNQSAFVAMFPPREYTPPTLRQRIRYHLWDWRQRVAHARKALRGEGCDSDY